MNLVNTLMSSMMLKPCTRQAKESLGLMVSHHFHSESAFFMILNTRSISHLQAVFVAYLAKHGKTIAKVIKSEFNGEMENTLIAIGTTSLK